MSSLPPGPRSPHLAMISLMRDACAYYAKCVEHFGDPFTLPTPFGQVVMTGTPEGIGEIYGADPDTFDVFAEKLVEPFLGPASLMLSSGRQHIRRRQLLTPCFGRSALAAHCATMQDTAAQFAARLRAGERFVAQEAMHALAFEIILHILFGPESLAQRSLRAAFVAAQRSISPPITFMLALRRSFMGFGPWARFERAMHALDAAIAALIAERRTGLSAGGLIDVLLAAKVADGSPLSDAEVRDHLVSLMAAGHETLASGLSWALYWTHRHTAVRARLRDELDAADCFDDPQRIARLPYLDAVYRETLRLSPILPEVSRLLCRPFRLLGYDLPAGIGVATLASVVHMRADLYPAPQLFQPERFLARDYSAYEFVPFGGGLHRCLGATLAMYEMKIVLATLLRDLELRLVSDRPVRASRQRSVPFGPSRPIVLAVAGTRQPRQRMPQAAE